MSATLEKRLLVMFKGLDRDYKADSFPRKGALANLLREKFGKDKKQIKDGDSKLMQPKEAVLFGSAAVEIWLRSIHSFLISCALTKSSPIWATVSGYYASHYSVRGIAHLLGYFQLRSIKKIVEVELTSGRYYACISKKHAGDREHRYYWRVVKKYPKFIDNPLFTTNPDDHYESDSAHRSVANYFDHISHFSAFRPLSKSDIAERIVLLSKVELSSAPIPRKNEFPDTENVQLAAYHRMVSFRKLLDEILGQKSRFWNHYRNPSWCRDYLNFQVVQPTFLENYSS